MNHLISFLVILSIIGCHAQTSVDVWVQDSVLCPDGYLSTNFIGVKMDATTGIATVNFKGGDNADHSYVLSFETEEQSGAIGWDTTIPITFSTAATYWIYLAGYGTTYNYDWIEIRVVASTFSGTITALYGTAPSGWYEGWPPYYATMVSGKVPPPSHPAPATTSISKILVPILVVVIVLAIAIPAGVYVYRRRQAKKMMDAQLQASTSENQVPVQMNSVVV